MAKSDDDNTVLKPYISPAKNKDTKTAKNPISGILIRFKQLFYYLLLSYMFEILMRTVYRDYIEDVVNLHWLLNVYASYCDLWRNSKLEIRFSKLIDRFSWSWNKKRENRSIYWRQLIRLSSRRCLRLRRRHWLRLWRRRRLRLGQRHQLWLSHRRRLRLGKRHWLRPSRKRCVRRRCRQLWNRRRRRMLLSKTLSRILQLRFGWRCTLPLSLWLRCRRWLQFIVVETAFLILFALKSVSYMI